MYQVYLTKLADYFVALFELEEDEFELKDFWEPLLGLFVVIFSFFILRAVIFRG